MTGTLKEQKMQIRVIQLLRLVSVALTAGVHSTITWPLWMNIVHAYMYVTGFSCLRPRPEPGRLQGAEVHKVHLWWSVHQCQPHQRAGVCWGMPASTHATQLDRWGGSHRQVLEPPRCPGVALCHWAHQDPTDPATVPGRKLQDLQDNCGDFLQVQAL